MEGLQHSIFPKRYSPANVARNPIRKPISYFDFL